MSQYPQNHFYEISAYYCYLKQHDSEYHSCGAKIIVEHFHYTKQSICT